MRYLTILALFLIGCMGSEAPQDRCMEWEPIGSESCVHGCPDPYAIGEVRLISDGSMMLEGDPVGSLAVGEVACFTVTCEGTADGTLIAVPSNPDHKGTIALISCRE